MERRIPRKCIEEFVALIQNRNFISFSQLSYELGMLPEEIISLKCEFEEELRREDKKVHLISRIDLEPPGFQIES